MKRNILLWNVFRLMIPAVLLFAPSAMADWDFSRSSIPTGEIMSGGPPRDGIPALTNPRYVSSSEADFMRDDEDVLGLVVGGEARAYPIRVLSWHELVNDTIVGEPVLVSW
jgi:hypothetical protein